MPAPRVSKINGLDIFAAEAQYVASSNVEGPLGPDSIASASYVDPTFISASAAASGFGSGGGGSTSAETASLALTVSSSIVTDNISYRVALWTSAGNAAIAQNSNISYNPSTNKFRVTSGQIEATGITGSINGTVSDATSASFASTASYVNTLNQDVTILGNLNVIGTASYSYVSASQLNVGTNTISVNVAEPAQRFGGLVVYDSGSLSHQATASFLWDSENNKWIYQNVSGSGYDGGMAIFGPRNTAGLGNEQGTTNNALMKGQGGDHITSSRIFDNGTIIYTTSDVQITGSLIVTGNINATASWATIAVSSSTTNNTNSGTHRLVFVNASPGTTPLYIQPFSATIDPSTGHITAIAFSGSFNGNLTGTSSYATQALTASYALSSPGGGGGVTSIIAGTGISVDQSTGDVTITNTGGGGGGLTFQQTQMIAFLGS